MWGSWIVGIIFGILILVASFLIVIFNVKPESEIIEYDDDVLIIPLDIKKRKKK